MKRMQNDFPLLVLALMMSFGITSCHQSGNAKKNDKQTASNEKNSGGQTGGAGSITLPEGSDNDDQLVTEDGAAVASDVAGAYLQLPAGIKAAGPSVSIKPAGSIKPGQLALEVTIPLTDEMMALVWSEPENLVVLYQVETSDGKSVYGLIPRSELKLEDGAVTFLWKGPGNYQAAVLPELVTEPKESEPTDVPILTAVQESQVPLVSWSQPAGSFSASPRQVVLSATPSVSPSSLLSCVAVLDEDQTPPFDLSVSTSGATSAVFAIARQTAHTVYGRFQCLDSSGRLTTSGWSAAISVSAIPAPVFSAVPAAVDAFVGKPFSLSMPASGAVSYALVPNSMDCDTAGAWAPAITINTSTGMVSGTPGTAGVTCTITASAQNAGGSSQRTLSVRIWADSGNICDAVSSNTCTISTTKSFADLSMFKHTGDLVVASGGHLQGDSGAEFSVSVSGNITVQSGGLISGQRVFVFGQNITVEGAVRANAMSSYTGATANALYSGGDTGQGAPHGGDGGEDAVAQNVALAYGNAEQPSTMGAAGEPGSGASGGLGGGAIRLTAIATLTVNGSIEANGGAGGNGSTAGGGGSGGSIWLNAATFAGNGSLTANGGNGGDDLSVSESGGGGAGGRIAVYYSTNNFSGTMSASGGAGGTGSGSLGGTGATGTMQSFAAPVRAHEVFVTSATYTGNLGGLQGADNLCQARADAAALAGRWKAILSGSGVLARDRVPVGGRLHNRAATYIASSGANFWGGFLSSNISTDEHGSVAAANAWTGTTVSGSASPSQCAGWTSGSASVQGEVGDHNASSISWLGGSTQTCDQQQALYCMSQ